MLGALKNFFGVGKNAGAEALSSSVKGSVSEAHRLAQELTGKQLTQNLIWRTRDQIGGVLGRYTRSGRRVELSLEDHKENPVEAFVSRFHELMHDAGVMWEGGAEGLSQMAAKLSGRKTKGVAYPEQTRSFNRVTELLNPGVTDLRQKFRRMVQIATRPDFEIRSHVAAALRKNGHSSAHAHQEAEKLLAA